MKTHCRDIDIYYEEYGSGEPLILLHGNSQDSKYFSRQITAFSKKYRVITPDARGHGKTGHGKEQLTFDVLTEDLKIFLDTLECKQVYLLGFSDGANTALHFLLKYPSYVKKAVLNSPNLFPDGMTLPAKLYVEAGYLLSDLRSTFGKKLEHPKAKHWKHQREHWALMQQHPMLTTEDLKQISVPVLIIAGSLDIIRLSHTKAIVKAIPHATLVLIKGGTHFCARQKYKIFNKHVFDYLTRKEHQ